MKQFILTHKLLCIILSCVIVAGAACAVVLPIALKHEHTFSTEWTSDETNHWHQATCEHKDEKSGLAAHDFNDGEITTPATEEAAGVKTFTCKTCGFKKTEEIKKLEHTHKFANEWTSDETNHWHAATCDHKDEKDELAAHDFDEGVITTPATEEAAGVKTFTCNTCGYEKNEEIKKLEHFHEFDYENIKSDATDHWFECRCGEKDEIEPHAFGNWSEKTAAAVDQNKQYSRKCKDCQYEDVLTFDNTKTNGTYCVAIKEIIKMSGKKYASVQVLRGTITVGDNFVIDGLDGTFEIAGIKDSKGEDITSASFGQSVSIEMGTEDGDLDQVENPKVGGRLAYEPDTAKAYTTFTALIKIDLSNYSSPLYAGKPVELDLYNIGTGLMSCQFVLPGGVTLVKDGESYVVTITLPNNASRALWAGMEFVYKCNDASGSKVVVARGIILAGSDNV